MAAISLEDTERRKAWGFVTPALAWTIVFFVAPFLFMAAMSLWAQQERSQSSRLELWQLRRLLREGRPVCGD